MAVRRSASRGELVMQRLEPFRGKDESRPRTAGLNSSGGLSSLGTGFGAGSSCRGWLPIDFPPKQLARADVESKRAALDAESKRKLMPEENQEHIDRLRSVFPFRGYIDGTEHRGISLKQLRQVVFYAKSRCHRWWDIAPPAYSKTSGQELAPGFLNLYHMNAWVIRPATKERNCAMVEVLTDREQPPAWFISHWWGEPVLHFLKCVEFMAKQRELGEDVAFWVCAYANRQHSLGDDISDDPRKTSFFKALVIAEFKVLLILNGGSASETPGMPFLRVWCAFEETCCLEQADSPLDVVSFHGQSVELVTRGLTHSEAHMERVEPGAGTAAKTSRERSFPPSLIEAGLAFDIVKAQASVAADRDHILNSVAGLDLTGAPPEEHALLTEANLRLRSLFARTFFRRVLSTASPLADGLAQAIHADVQRTSLSLDLAGLEALRDHEMDSVIACLPPKLRELTLDMQGASISDTALQRLAEGLPQALESLNLDFSRCGGIGDEGLEQLRAGLPSALARLRINFTGTYAWKANLFQDISSFFDWKPLQEEGFGPVWWKPGKAFSFESSVEYVQQTAAHSRGKTSHYNRLLSPFSALEFLQERGALYPGENLWAAVETDPEGEFDEEEGEYDMMEEDAPRRQPVAPKPPPTTMRDWVQVGDSGYPAGTLWSDVPGSQRAGFLAECGLPPSGDADPDAMPPWHTSGEPVRHDGLVVNSVILFQNTLSSSQGEGEEEGYGDEF